MSYRHGVYASEEATSLRPPVRVNTALPVVVGTAPVQTLEDGVTRPVNSPKLIFKFADFVREFGSLPPGAKAADYTLHEFASIYLARYNVAPAVFINVFDPEKHKSNDGQPDVKQVTPDDIIGGIDGQTYRRTGLELVEEIFPRFSLIPGQLLAPHFSGHEAVALVLGAKCLNINGHFRCTGIVDIPDSVSHFTEAPAWVKDNNLTDANLIMMFGRPVLGDVVEAGSSHLAGVISQRDFENEGIPFWSPSNKRLQANGVSHGGKELHLGPSEAAYLNGQGINTALNFIGGMVAWGNRTAAYPGVTDVKDTFIPLRRMFNFCGNTLVTTAWQFLDTPLMRRRLIESVCDTFNVWLNGLAAREFIHGGRVEFMQTDNPTTDLMDGIARFRVFFTPPSPAREMDFIIEYDPGYLRNSYGVQE
jgi:phage tail sheath protein FI